MSNTRSSTSFSSVVETIETGRIHSYGNACVRNFNDYAGVANSDSDCIEIQNKTEPSTTQTTDANGTIFSTVVCIIANVVGAGLLSLPCTFREAGALPGAVVMAITAVLNGIAAVVIAHCAASLDVYTYRELGERLLGKSWGTIAQLIMACYTFGSCVTYVVLLGDFMPPVLSNISDSTIISNRTYVIIFVAILVLFPLTLLKDLSSLRHTSTVSLVCITYAVIVLMVQVFTEHQTPEIDVYNVRSTVLKAFPVINVSFTFHYNVPRFYRELKPHYRNLKSFSWIILISFGTCLTLYVATATFGYIAFGETTLGDVLDNFGDRDIKANVARFALGITVAFIYPLAFHSLRTTIFTLAPPSWGQLSLKSFRRKSYKPTSILIHQENSPSNQDYHEENTSMLHSTTDIEQIPSSISKEPTITSRLCASLIFMTATVIVGIVLPNVLVVLGYKGALFGSCVVYIFPGAMIVLEQLGAKDRLRNKQHYTEQTVPLISDQYSLQNDADGIKANTTSFSSSPRASDVDSLANIDHSRGNDTSYVLENSARSLDSDSSNRMKSSHRDDVDQNQTNTLTKKDQIIKLTKFIVTSKSGIFGACFVVFGLLSMIVGTIEASKSGC